MEFAKIYISTTLITLLLIVAFSASDALAAKRVSQSWICKIDLHQGDKGQLEISRTNDEMAGAMKIRRGDNEFNHRVRGTWTGNALKFTRFLSANSQQEFIGIVSPLRIKTAKMGGRFAARYNGVWSADCTLLKEDVKDTDDDDSEPDPPQEKAGPAVSRRATPYKPTTKDRIRFWARASHSDGVKSVAFFLDGKMLKRCLSAECNFTSKPLKAGKHTWYVEALSKTGFKSPVYKSDLIVKKEEEAKTGNCQISGQATGTAAGTSNIFSVNLFGPNNANLFRESVRFKNKRYRLTGLPAGTYRLVVDTRADIAVGAQPSPVTVTCTQSGKITRNFSFR